MNGKWKVGLSVGLAVALLLGALGLMMPVIPEEAVERSDGISAGVYKTSGGDKLVVQSGGEIEVQSGGTLDLQSGATTGIDAALDLDSTLNVDGAATLNSTLDVDGNISSGTGAVTVTDSLNATGAVDFDSTLNVDGATTLAGLLYPSFADETITDGETLTPTVTVYALDSAGAVTMTLAASGTEGQILILIGDDANTITVADTNVRTNDGGVQAIGQYDVIMWIYQDSEWVEISESNNS